MRKTSEKKKHKSRCDDFPIMPVFLPAPVVPPDLVDDKMAGDWWMVRSLPATVSSIVEAEGSMKPRFWDGMS